jgi:hypothetical protein
LVILVALIAIGASLAFAQPGFGKGVKVGKDLFGSWMVTATFAPEFETPPIVSPGTFTSDGLVINSDSTGKVALGLWAENSDGSFSVTMSGAEMMGEGEQATSILYTINALVTISEDGQIFDGDFKNTIRDAATGITLFEVTGTIHGDRMQLESLE